MSKREQFQNEADGFKPISPNDPATIKARIAERLCSQLRYCEENAYFFNKELFLRTLDEFERDLNTIPSTSPYKHLTPAQLVDVIAQREEQLKKVMEDKELLDNIDHHHYNAEFYMSLFGENNIREAIRNAINKQKEKE